MQLEVRSFNVTWRRDLWGYRVIVFLCGKFSNCYQNNYGKFVFQNRQNRFSAICENSEGRITAPGRARVKNK